MKNVLLILLSVSVLAGGAIAEDVQLPDAVKTAFDAKFAGAKIKKVKLEDENGAKNYDISFKNSDGKKASAEYKADGTLVADTVEIKVSDLPEAVTKIVASTYPGSKIEEAKLENEGGKQLYEVEIELAGVDGKEGKDMELEVASDGSKILEAKEKAEDKEDEKSDDKKEEQKVGKKGDDDDDEDDDDDDDEKEEKKK